MYKEIELILEAFDAHKLKYIINEREKYQEIMLPFGIKNGPSVNVRYISFNQGNGISIRITSLINNVPKENRLKVLDTCNELNSHFKFVKFVLDQDDCIHVHYDFLTHTGNDCLGEMAFEAFLRIMQIMNQAYPEIVKALYLADNISSESAKTLDMEKDLLQLLKKNKDEINIKISKSEPPDESQPGK